MAKLTLERLHKRYGELSVVDDVSLSIADGEFLSLLGPSGCGKTTILRMVAGLVDPSGGTIRIGDQDVTQLPPNKREIGLVFQSYALFPHLSVAENVAFGLRRRGVSGNELKERVTSALALVRLSAYGERKPRELSGGQQQRVAIARAVAPRPRVLLFDEPLSNLDAQLRDEMQIELKRLQSQLHLTSVFVTHDQQEALSLSDRVCVLAGGRIQQIATPEDLYHRPANAFIASFIGKPNRLVGDVAERRGAGGVLAVGGFRLPSAQVDAPVGTEVDVIVRQEAVQVHRHPVTDGIPATISLRSFSGAHVQYVVTVAPGVELLAQAPSTGDAASLAPATQVWLDIDPAAVFALPKRETQKRETHA